MNSPNGGYDIRNRAQWILRLLYAPDRRGRHKRPLFGKTRIMKATFLLHRKLNEHFDDVTTGFDFSPDKYGPLDPGVYDALNYLENNELITVTPPEDHAEQYDSIQYSLTNKGGIRAEELYSELPDDQRDLVDWVKREHALNRLGDLLNFVYPLRLDSFITSLCVKTYDVV